MQVLSLFVQIFEIKFFIQIHNLSFKHVKHKIHTVDTLVCNKYNVEFQKKNNVRNLNIMSQNPCLHSSRFCQPLQNYTS